MVDLITAETHELEDRKMNDKNVSSVSAKYISKIDGDVQYTAMYIENQVHILYRDTYEKYVFSTIREFDNWLHEVIPLSKYQHDQLVQTVGMYRLRKSEEMNNGKKITDVDVDVDVDVEEELVVEGQEGEEEQGKEPRRKRGLSIAEYTQLRQNQLLISTLQPENVEVVDSK